MPQANPAPACDSYRWYHKGALIREAASGNFISVIEPWDGKRCIVQWFGTDGAPLLDAEPLARMAAPAAKDYMVRSVRGDVPTGIEAGDPSLAVIPVERDRRRIVGMLGNLLGSRHSVQPLEGSSGTPRPIDRLRAALGRSARLAAAASVVYIGLGAAFGPEGRQHADAVADAAGRAMTSAMVLATDTLRSAGEAAGRLSGHSLEAKHQSAQTRVTRDMEIRGRSGDLPGLPVIIGQAYRPAVHLSGEGAEPGDAGTRDGNSGYPLPGRKPMLAADGAEHAAAPSTRTSSGRSRGGDIAYRPERRAPVHPASLPPGQRGWSWERGGR